MPQHLPRPRHTFSHPRAPRTHSSPAAGTPTRCARPVDVHPPDRPRYWSCQCGSKHAPTLHSAQPSLEPQGGCGPRMTPRPQPPCPGGQPMLKPGVCITAQRGESLLVSMLLVCCRSAPVCLACFCTVTLKFRFSPKLRVPCLSGGSRQ